MTPNLKTRSTMNTGHSKCQMVERPLVLELVGICGAGKTTLQKLLTDREPRLRRAVPPSKISYSFFLMKHFCTWYPIYLRNHRRDRWFTPQEIRLIAYLETWAQYLCSQALRTATVPVLEPGSVYWLTMLRDFGPDVTRCEDYRQHWRRMLRVWASSLCALVWLDASDEELYRRVFARDHWHEIKNRPRGYALEYFKRQRHSYAQIMEEMSKEGGPQILSFRTETMPTEQIADRILADRALRDALNRITR